MIYLTDTKEWLQPTVSGDLPAARGQHSAAVVGDHLVLYGGSSDFSAELMVCQKYFTDTFILNTGKELYLTDTVIYRLFVKGTLAEFAVSLWHALEALFVAMYRKYFKIYCW
jgi:hypothetical protein